ncbi:MAG: sel1 repeat family protein [Bacteroidales bacterium]|nr:sel1 repeat family protein [Bacteroidales bacterium]
MPLSNNIRARQHAQPLRSTPHYKSIFPTVEFLIDRIELKLQARRLKRSGDRDKLFEAAKIYDGLKKYRDAFECYEQAAQKGHLQACYELVLCYDFPKGCTQDLHKALSLCLDLAKKGHVEAMERVGMYFEHGIGTYKDTELAHYWFNEAAQRGNKLAQRKLKR